MANIILIGMRGSGKSSIGAKLAELIDRDFLDTDHMIEKVSNIAISSMVEQQGWEYFRQVEKNITANLDKLNNTVISTGGGIVTDPENIENLKKAGKVIYLEASPDVLIERLLTAKARPSLMPGLTLEEEVHALFKEREELYRQAADLTINMDQQSEDHQKDHQEKAEVILSTLNLLTNL